jgi:hypothetical protein
MPLGGVRIERVGEATARAAKAMMAMKDFMLAVVVYWAWKRS